MEAILQAEPRSETGKGPAHRLRAAGRVPATLYGAGVEATSIHVGALDLLHVFHAMGQASVLVDLKLDGQEYLTIAREIQRDLIRNRFIHVDFMAVRRDEKITVNIELQEIGVSVGVHAGGVIEHHLREVEVECLPANVPQRIEFDIAVAGEEVPEEAAEAAAEGEGEEAAEGEEGAEGAEGEGGEPSAEGTEGEPP